MNHKLICEISPSKAVVLKVGFHTNSTWEFSRNSDSQPLPSSVRQKLEVEPSSQCFNKLLTAATLMDTWESGMGIIGGLLKDQNAWIPPHFT